MAEKKPAAPEPAPVIDAAYVQREFGPSFKLDTSVKPLLGDLFGDGREDLVLVGTSPSPLISQSTNNYRVEDPYDRYFGNGDPKITSQFSLHFDGSERVILIVCDWRHSPAKRDAKDKWKFVLINTPFETISLSNLHLKHKQLKAIEAVDRTTLHALIFWDGHHWRWSAQGMEGDDTLYKMPSEK
ncbi:MAG: hypothetical protein P4M01_04055 [Acidobacteriota bacterium]|nr:hypothetical protein [Acidobacteriota bacterium]